MNILATERPLHTPHNKTRYWLIHTVHGKGKAQTHRYLCTVASMQQANPVRLAKESGFTGPFHCIEITPDQYCQNLKRVFNR